MKWYNIGLKNRDNISDSFGGAFPGGTFGLITGQKGSGKSVWSQRFTYGFLTEGYHVSYITPEMNSKEFINSMGRLGYNGVADHLLSGQLLFLSAPTNTRKLDTNNTFSLIRKLFIQKEGELNPFNSSVVIIDQFGSMLRNDPKFNELDRDSREIYLENVMNSFAEQVNRDKAIILTVNPKHLEEFELSILNNRSNVNLRLEVEEQAGGVDRRMFVDQFLRPQGDVDDVITYDVQQGRGIIIESTIVA